MLGCIYSIGPQHQQLPRYAPDVHYKTYLKFIYFMLSCRHLVSVSLSLKMLSQHFKWYKRATFTTMVQNNIKSNLPVMLYTYFEYQIPSDRWPYIICSMSFYIISYQMYKATFTLRNVYISNFLMTYWENSNIQFWGVNITLEGRHNERDSVSNHWRLDCLLNRFFRHRSKKTSKPRVTGLCEKNSPFSFDDVILMTPVYALGMPHMIHQGKAITVDKRISASGASWNEAECPCIVMGIRKIYVSRLWVIRKI